MARRPPEADPHRLSGEELQELVDEYRATGRPLDQLINERLFGSHRLRPRAWRDWPVSARESWDRAIALSRMERDSVRSREKDPPTLDDSWEAVLGLLDGPWPAMPGVSWGDVADRLGVGPRVAIYHLGIMGWEFSGRYSTRRVERAPCRGCGTPAAADRFRSPLGPCCEG